jgi:hypothetical protein
VQLSITKRAWPGGTFEIGDWALDVGYPGVTEEFQREIPQENLGLSDKLG